MGDKKIWRKRRGDGLVAWRASKRAKLLSDCENKENVSNTTHILASVESFLESSCRARRFDVIYLPKFHCELNFIEQCWGYAKRIYRMMDPSSSESVLEQNVINSLNAVPLSSMRRYVLCFKYSVSTIKAKQLTGKSQLCNPIYKVYGCLSKRIEWSTGCMGYQEVPRTSCPSSKHHARIR